VLTIGDEHGGAGSNCMELIAEGLALVASEGLSIDDAAGRLVDRERAAGRRLPGFGHRVHTHDPRTPLLFDMARARGIAGDGIRFTEAIERALAARVRPLTTNIDGALAALLHDLGYPPPAGRLIFIVGRVAGIAAEVAEEHAREKPMRIRVPVVYDGEPPRSL